MFELIHVVNYERVIRHDIQSEGMWIFHGEGPRTDTVGVLLCMVFFYVTLAPEYLI